MQRFSIPFYVIMSKCVKNIFTIDSVFFKFPCFILFILMKNPKLREALGNFSEKEGGNSYGCAEYSNR